MIINGNSLLMRHPIKDMVDTKVRQHGVSFGLGEAGYDIRLKQELSFHPYNMGDFVKSDGEIQAGHFIIASAIEEFDMPEDLVGIIHDKSTWARQGISVFNTVIEPGWRGFLTLEIVFHGRKEVIIPAGSGIAQVIFHQTTDYAGYTGKYQDQADEATPSRFQ